MPTFTTNQWVILFLVLVLGWLLGLISRSGGKKWRIAYEAERDARAEEARDHAAILEGKDARIAELEQAAPATVVAARPVTTAETLDLRRDDLGQVRGIGPDGQNDLNELGIYRYDQLAAMGPEEERALEDKLGADHGYIRQEQWREQAALLRDGKVEEHRAAFG